MECVKMMGGGGGEGRGRYFRGYRKERSDEIEHCSRRNKRVNKTGGMKQNKQSRISKASDTLISSLQFVPPKRFLSCFIPTVIVLDALAPGEVDL